MTNISRLSSLPMFLRGEQFWRGVLDPNISVLRGSNFEELRVSTASHRWSISKQTRTPHLGEKQQALLDVAQSILERGIWTPPSWKLEQYLAQCFERHLEWKFSTEEDQSGLLACKIEEVKNEDQLSQALVTGRLKSESPLDVKWETWQWGAEIDDGSREEQDFFENVLYPVLGFPLLDFLIPQRSLPSMGLDFAEFIDQRTDFALDTGRNLKLVIEVDGPQHQEPSQRKHDQKRDRELEKQGWIVWRIDVQELDNKEELKNRLIKNYLENKEGKPKWGYESTEASAEPRSKELMTCVWGATAAYRIQYLLLEGLRIGHLKWDEPWIVYCLDHDTDIVDAAIEDIEDWFGRLRKLRGLSPQPSITKLKSPTDKNCQLVVDISVTKPYMDGGNYDCPTARSRPANLPAAATKSNFSSCEYLEVAPDKVLLETFVQDFFRIREFREGQYEILSRLLMGKDVIGLLPTGGGKSLTYQLSGILLGGLTIYVAPIKSLLQDQHERFLTQGIDNVQAISSALSQSDRLVAEALLSTGSLRYLLVAPERFLKQDFRDQLAQASLQLGYICQVVIDECHCVSEWGHSFRPAYLSLSRIARERTKRMGVSAPLCALTGTASSIVLADVKRELNITQDEAIIRASSMDRAEIELKCINISQDEKINVLQEIIKNYDQGTPNASDGVLIFCRTTNGPQGVTGVASNLLRIISPENVKYYSGGEPNWRNVAAVRTRTKATRVTESQIQASIPSFARDNKNNKREWEDVKADVQRDFICGLEKRTFRYLVATHAFGMGIDKPSIRLLIHYMAPQSPEAYYQEVGRAARDGKPAQAILLFSDEEPAITDEILSPETDIRKAKSLYKKFNKEQPWEGGDFLRTFYFHDGTFSGQDVEAGFIVQTLSQIRTKLTQSKALIFQYHESEKRDADQWSKKINLEYTLVRLIHLGVIDDYTTDYNKKQFRLSPKTDWITAKDDPGKLAEFLAEHFRMYARRYQVGVPEAREQQIRNASTVEEIENKTAEGIVGYIYDQIERTRRQASRQMLELSREAFEDTASFREKLLLYLQVSEKFSRELERLVSEEDRDRWKQVLSQVQNPDEIKELHGACQRVLESYPTHSGLLAISAATRLNPSETAQKRSQEEMQTAINNTADSYGFDEATKIGVSIVEYCDGVDDQLSAALEETFATWLIKTNQGEEALSRFFHRKTVRDVWIKSVVQEALSENIIN